MWKNIFYAFLLCYVVCSQIRAGLIDSLAAINTKNASLAEGLPKKKNSTSKYSCLLNNNKKPLNTAVDAHKPVKYKLQDAVEKNVDVNKLSEKQLEAIGDAAMAEKLTAKPKTTSKSPKTDEKGKAKSAEPEKCEN